MKKLAITAAFLAAVLIGVHSHALAGPIGFFHDIDAAERTASIAMPAVELEKATTSCAIQILYNASSPSSPEIGYIGTGCHPTAVVAIDAARDASKALSAPGEPAHATSYACGVMVTWEPSAAAQPAISTVGGDPCLASTHSAIFYASYSVECTHLPRDQFLRCRP